ncbi:MAG: hypothetical protein HFF62_15810 [Oscillospiraceae bacterium]|mgnify:FL=1|nr:hypothetical protein [Oscillospiraceae bacterium]
MKITNKTTKIIGIAGESILPNESADIPDSEANSSVVQHLAKIGKVVIGDEEAPKETAAKAPAPAPGTPAGTGSGKDDGKKNGKQPTE